MLLLSYGVTLAKMTFTLHITVNTNKEAIKHQLMEEIALYLKRNGYKFDVGFDPNELDIDKLGKA